MQRQYDYRDAADLASDNEDKLVDIQKDIAEIKTKLDRIMCQMGIEKCYEKECKFCP